MTDTAQEKAHAHAALTARPAVVDARLLRAVHTGLLSVPADYPGQCWEADDGGSSRITIRRRAAV